MTAAPPTGLSALTLPWPADWTALFGADRPLIVEIGFGRAAFLRHLAVSQPDHSIVGLEIANQCMEAGEALILREHLHTIRVIHATAETALTHLFVPGSIAGLHINFPDPWFKSNHERRRLMRPDTLALMVDRLAAGAMLYLATDIAEYAMMSDALLRDQPGLENTLPEGWAHARPGDGVMTKYESIAQRAGRACYYFAYRRTAAPGESFPVVRDLAMPHAVVHLPLTPDAIIGGFQPRHIREEAIHIHLMEAFRGRIGLLVEAHVGEPTIRQHIMVSITPYDGGTQPDAWTVQLATVGQPRATRGTHLAVRAVRDWLLTLHSEARPIKEKLQTP